MADFTKLSQCCVRAHEIWLLGINSEAAPSHALHIAVSL